VPQLSTFLESDKSARKLDVRSKIFILITFSFSIFFANFTSLGILFAIFLILIFLDFLIEYRREPQVFKNIFLTVLKISIPLYIICVFSFLANALVIKDTGLAFTEDGVTRGLFYVGRILLLGWSSLYVATTISLIEFSYVFKWFFWPLRKLKVPVQDASLAVSIALRFIPEIFFEFQNIREAQWCRGAKMTSGGLITRTKAHTGCFVPLILRMMANVDDLSDALTARCWGVFEVPPREELERVGTAQILCVIFVCFLIVGVITLV
jgi:energy-coupling factor transport system permease protein